MQESHETPCEFFIAGENASIPLDSVDEAFVSQFITLEPGDIFSTGTPAGVGHAKKVPLEPGDRIKGKIKGLGTLANTVESL